MKKFLLSIFALMLAVFSVQAETLTLTVGTDITATSAKFLDGSLMMTTAKNNSGTAPAYNANNKELRLYYNAQGNGCSVTFTTDGTIKITGVKLTASTSPTVKYSVNGGNMVSAGDWSNKTITISGIEATESIEIKNANTTNTQLRITSFVITYETVGVSVSKPEFTPADGTRFDESLEVTIGVENGLKSFYSTDGGANYNEGNSVVIAETTTILAYAMDGAGNKSAEVSATYTKNEPLPDGWIVDVLTHQWAGITGTNYSAWSNKRATSSAFYAGNSAGDKSSIQLRSNNSNSGIVTTQSGGKAKKIVVEWNSETASDRTLDVYGKNTAYSAATDLYSASTQGTKIGSVKCGTSTELVIDGDYEYIGLRSASGAMYLTSISITWDASAGVTVVPETPILTADGEFFVSKDIEIANFNNYEDGTTVYYSINGGEPKVYTAAFEITTSCEIVAYAINGELKSAESTAEYTRIANDPVITVVGDTDADAFEESIEVEIGTLNGAKAYYTLNNEEPTEESTEYEGTLTIKATATLKVIAIEEGKYRSKNVVAKTFTMALKDTSVDTDAPSVTFDATAQNYDNQTTITSATIAEGITATFEKGTNSNAPKYYSSGTAIRCYGGNNFTITSTVGTITKIVLTYGNSDGSNTITTDCGDFSTNTWVGNSNSVVFTIGGTSGNRRIQEITVTYGEPENESYSLNVTKAGWATLFLDYAVEIPEDVTCYVISGVSEESVQLEEVDGDILPANTGVIVKAESKEYVFEPTTKEAGVVSLMSGSTSNKYFFEDAYVLGIVDGEVGLYKAKMEGGVWLNNANKAYLPIASGQALSASLRFDFGGTTGVEKVEIRNEKEEIYDLTGRRVNEITKAGVYVVGGRKVMVK